MSKPFVILFKKLALSLLGYNQACQQKLRVHLCNHHQKKPVWISHIRHFQDFDSDFVRGSGYLTNSSKSCWNMV